jgi:hypothetical protein
MDKIGGRFKNLVSGFQPELKADGEQSMNTSAILGFN